MGKALVVVALSVVLLMGAVGCTTLNTNQKVEVTVKETGSGDVQGQLLVDGMLKWGPAKVPTGDGATLVLHDPKDGKTQLTTGMHKVKYILVVDKDKPGAAQVMLKADGNTVKVENTVGAAAGQAVEGTIQFDLKAPGKKLF